MRPNKAPKDWLDSQESETWQRAPLKQVVSLVKDTPVGSGASSLSLEGIEPWTGHILSLGAPGIETATLARRGDVGFSKLRPYLAKAVLFTEDTACNGEIIVMRPTVISGEYLAYMLLSPRLVDYLDAGACGAKMPRTNWDQLGSLLVPVPPIEAQREIVRYLDEKTRALDAAVAKCRKASERAAAYVESEILSTIEHGIEEDPASCPELKLSHVASSTLGLMIDQKKDTGQNVHEYLSNRDVQWFSVHDESLDSCSFPIDARARFQIVDGDVLVCEGGEVGRSAVWRGPSPEFYFQKAIHRVRLDQAVLMPEYFAYQMYAKAHRDKFVEIRKGESTIAHLPADQLMQLTFNVPSLDEQARVVRRLDRARSLAGKAGELAKEAEGKLLDCRLSLVHETVVKGVGPEAKEAF